MQISFYINSQGAGWTYRNMGQGPAIVYSFEVWLDGQPLRSWQELRRKLDLSGPASFSVAGLGIISTPYKTGDVTEIFWVEPQESEKLFSNSKRVRIATCYCSLFQDCWKSYYGNENQDSDIPEDVSSCEVVAANELKAAYVVSG